MSNYAFHYVLPKSNIVPVALKSKTMKNYQRINFKPAFRRQISVNPRPAIGSTINKEFIPTSLTVPHINQVNPISIIPSQTRKNEMTINNNRITPNLNIIQRPITPGLTLLNGNLTPRIINPLINNNTINNQSIVQNNLQPGSLINLGNINGLNQIPTTNNFISYIQPSTTIQTPMNINQINPYPNNTFQNPGELLNLKEYELLGEIGKGSFGKIYKVKWKVNQRFYALKTEILEDMEGINQRLGRGKAMRNFIQSTGCQGVVNIYGSYVVKQGNLICYYELMDLCDTDFEKEIKMRSIYGRYFTEAELDNIIKQLISTLSFLQKQHITHRDIKPQNILIANGRYKLCDFGDIRVMKRGGLVVQRIRGSELYMSPILFYGLRKGFQAIEHNTYKSDVFSLGMCLFYAACLSFDGPVEIREVNDMNMKLQILKKYMGARYSPKLIKIFHLMLQNEESARPDFILLEDAIIRYGL